VNERKYVINQEQHSDNKERLGTQEKNEKQNLGLYVWR